MNLSLSLSLIKSLHRNAIINLINELPEVIKCIIFDYVRNTLNYKIECISDKFIGNPIYAYNICNHIDYFYHINKLTSVKTPLCFIELLYDDYLPPLKILNKLQKFSLCYSDLTNLPILPCIKFLRIRVGCTMIPNFVGLLDLICIECKNLTEIPNIVGLKKLTFCSCPNLIKIPNIVGLLKFDCWSCPKLINSSYFWDSKSGLPFKLPKLTQDF